MSGEMSDFFELTHDAHGGIAELVLNHPACPNTMTPAIFPALRDAVQALESLQQMAVPQSAIFHTVEMERAIRAWRDKLPGNFALLPPAAKA